MSGGQRNTIMALVGQTLDERYTMLSLLGEGGMGVVYKARDEQTGQEVAVKVLRDALLNDEDATKRFEREARALFGLSHPNILRVHNFGMLSARPYLVMDLLVGKGLDELVEEADGLPVEQAVGLFRQILTGLAHAHDKGAAHRDLKTENIHVAPNGHVTIVDFGLVKFMDSGEWGDTGKLTRMGAVFGTPAYMAPEQCTGVPADQRSDIYAAGVIFFEMLTGAWPFMEESRMKMYQAHLAKPVPPISTYLEGDTGAFDPFIAQAMHKLREKRYQSAGEMLNALNSACQNAPAAARMPATSAALHGPAGHHESQAAGMSRNLKLGLIAGSAILLVTVAVWMFLLLKS